MNGDIAEDLGKYFTTTVALMTTSSRGQDNVMAAEWTMQISYEPMLIAVFVNPSHVTHGMIIESKEFGVNFCSDEQATLAHYAGSYSRREMDKLSKEIFKTYKAKYIKAPMIEGYIANVECRLVAHHTFGDHTAFIGEAVAAKYDATKNPLVWHRWRYYKLGPIIPKK